MDEQPRISRDQDVNDTGEPIFRPAEKITEPVKPQWKWIWLVIVVIVILAWAFLYWYFQNHQAPYSAPIR